MSNSQVATVFLTEDCKYGVSFIEVSFYIGSSISAAKRWLKDEYNYKGFPTTGKCGLEGLLFCKEVIYSLKGNNVLVAFPDDKRKNVYSRLSSLGFKLRHFKSEPEYNFYLVLKDEWK